ncbi:MAG: FAD-dependent oxidoreductase [Actinomycetota bacterium]
MSTEPLVSPPDGPVVVVGGGIVGLSCAWFLRRAGADVIVLEAGERTGGGASRGNAGAICPSGVEPLASPGMLRAALDNLRRPDAVLHVHPASMPQMAGFLLRFRRSGTTAAYDRGVRALAQLGTRVTAAYDVLAEAGIGTHARRDGYLVAYRDPAAAVEEHARVVGMAGLGVCAVPEPLLGAAALRALEPLLGEAVVTGFVIPDERWIDASLLLDDLTAAAVAAGVDLRMSASASAVHDLGDAVEVDTPAGTVTGAVAVVAAGVWSRDLVMPLGVKLTMRAGKGYSFALHPGRMPDRLLYLPDAHVMASPLGSRLRIAGTMEFDGTIDRFRPERVQAIVRGLTPFLRDVDLSARTEEWVGPRPMTPDGLPVLGPLAAHPRVVLATGHNMLGVTLGPVTGEVIAGLVCAGDPQLDLAPFTPERFRR